METKKHHKKHDDHKHDLDSKKIGIALGLTFSTCMLLLVLMAATMKWGASIVLLLGNIYLGYDVSFKGAILGMVWGFLDGFVGGCLFACIYNKLGKCCKR